MVAVILGALLGTTVILGSGSPALAQTSDGDPWNLQRNMGYAFESNGQMKTYRLGTNNARNLLRGARRVPRGTLFFVGENGQLYMRTGSYLDRGGKFNFGPNN